jgi:hypothetical protein
MLLDERYLKGNGVPKDNKSGHYVDCQSRRDGALDSSSTDAVVRRGFLI